MIDGLRGIAAMMVVIFHLHENIRDSISSWFPQFLSLMISHGTIGVQIFFVISGFVIAYSVGDKHIDLKFIGKFALRRSIRLDPPYWVSMILAIFLIYLSTVLFSDIHRELPSTKTILAHLIYLQDILGYGNIIYVYWTLCLEVQFYLFLVALLSLSQKLNHIHSTRLALQSWWVKLLFFVLGLLSIANYFDLYTIEIEHTFLPYWHNFFLGALACWCILGWLKPLYFLVFWFILLVFAVYFQFELNAVTTLITGMAVFIAGIYNRLPDIFSSRPYQYLGKISYSLYLLHPIIGWRVISIGKRYLGPELSIIEGVLLFFSAVMISILVSHIVFTYVEKPSMAFSHKIKLN